MTKRMFLISSVVGVLVLGGVYFGWQWYSDGQPAFRGRALQVEGLPDEIVESWETAFREVSKKEELLGTIVEGSGYAEKLGVPPGEAVDDLGKAVKVRWKKAKGSIEVGLVGKRKNDEALKEIAQVLYQEAEKEVLKIEPTYQEYLEAMSKAREQSRAPESE